MGQLAGPLISMGVSTLMQGAGGAAGALQPGGTQTSGSLNALQNSSAGQPGLVATDNAASRPAPPPVMPEQAPAPTPVQPVQPSPEATQQQFSPSMSQAASGQFDSGLTNPTGPSVPQQAAEQVASPTARQSPSINQANQGPMIGNSDNWQQKSGMSKSIPGIIGVLAQGLSGEPKQGAPIAAGQVTPANPNLIGHGKKPSNLIEAWGSLRNNIFGQ